MGMLDPGTPPVSPSGGWSKGGQSQEVPRNHHATELGCGTEPLGPRPPHCAAWDPQTQRTPNPSSREGAARLVPLQP